MRAKVWVINLILGYAFKKRKKNRFGREIKVNWNKRKKKKEN